jgi:hypothetical protein
MLLSYHPYPTYESLLFVALLNQKKVENGMGMG